jgi:uncharacterized damage-inducible protein DinB
MKQMPWFERRFTFEAPASIFPSVLERLRGTPARVEERVRGVAAAILTRRDGDAWSIQEHVGHLLDLEPLWLGRLDDFAEGREELRPADLENRKTHAANHNARPLEQLLRELRLARAEIVERHEALDDRDLERTSLHPRLRQPMRLLDLMIFVAEHDDHHLARISELRRRFGAP